MRAVVMGRPGGPEVLEVVEVPTPVPGPGQIRVRAEAIGVGRADVLVRNGTYKWMPPLPTTPGTELVGIVDAVAADVSLLQVGQRVLVSARELPLRGGCYSEAICVPADAVFALPASISPVDAVSLPNIQFANALLDSVMGRPPESVLVLGAAGAVGSALTQVALSRGIRVIGAASTPDKRRYGRANGVDCFVSADPAHLADDVMAATGGRGVDVAFDHLGSSSIIACLHALAPLGTVVSYNVVQGAPSEDIFQALRTLLGRSLGVRVFSMHTFDKDRTTRRALMQRAIDDMAAGRLKAPTALRMPLARIREAHELLDTRGSMGKIVLEP
jgi:NADPH2:quinone reductase